MQTSWNLDQLVGYLGTWSACRAYRQRTGQDPVAAIRDSLHSAWGNPDGQKIIKWPLSLALGRNNN
jgi:hypothetical protein